MTNVIVILLAPALLVYSLGADHAFTALEGRQV